MAFELTSRHKKLSLECPKLMGILNVTPDSFSDGGQHFGVEAAVARGLKMIEEGADIVDVGGESTGPGSAEVSLEEELARVVPVIRALRVQNLEVWISVDTWKAEVARQAIEAGADMVNDVTALRGDLQMAAVVAQAKVPVVLMYSKDSTARTTREEVRYEDVVATVRSFLEERVVAVERAGIARDQIVIDPGMGAFVSGDPRYSVELLRRLRELEVLKCPILVGASRKGFIQQLGAGCGPEDRLEGSLAAATIALLNGAHIVRAHDVRETRRVMGMLKF